jgi:hypothetical protein
MTLSYRKFLEQSRTYLRRIFRKPAWDFNRVVADPRQAKDGGGSSGRGYGKCCAGA